MCKSFIHSVCFMFEFPNFANIFCAVIFI
uniref:Uncharacterized protein n=1 Tax=Zea mays TaxID=4577 RepID=B4FPV6_MAIZE|nr:unknown [Zea mays]